MNCGAISIEASRTPGGCDIDNIRGRQGYPYQSDLSGSGSRVGRAFWYDDIEFAGPILEDYFVRRFRVKFNPRLGFAEVRRMMTRIIRAAIHAYETDSWCLYRQNDLTKPELNFIELLWHDGYVDREIGKWNSDKSRSTASRFKATGFLKGIFGSQTNVRKIVPRKSCIQLRDATGEVIKAKPPGEMNSELGTLNKLTGAAKIACDGVEYTGLQYRRVFNRDWLHGGRFYCEFSQLPKASRSKMLIDGEATTELDFSSMHIHLAYAMVGDKFSGVDAYAVEGFTREEMKVASLICLNGGDARAVRSHWHTASLAASRPREVATYINRSKAAVEAFKTAHAPIGKIWEIPDIGLKLQYRDSCIMAECMRRLCELNIVPVSLHDSIRVQSRHADAVETIMREASFSICGIEIPVKRS